jgi:hypothetical protein
MMIVRAASPPIVFVTIASVLTESEQFYQSTRNNDVATFRMLISQQSVISIT